MYPRSLRSLIPPIAFVLACVTGLPLPLAAADAPKGQPVTVMVSGQGTPVEGVKVTLAPDTGVPAESWNTGTSTPLAVIATDATGHAQFPSVPPGRYIVTTSCGLPGNWIAGNYAS
jgi:protocatechuate 3,4-dioxygenase beta subunit